VTTEHSVSLPQLYEIEKACFSRKFLYPRQQFLEEAWRNELWLAKEDGQITGFLQAELDGKIAYISSIDVAPRFRGKGIATKLIAHCERDMRKQGARRIWLYVHSLNPAQTLYFKCGYRVTGMKRNYYGKDTHALIMTKVFR
jgi:ribosomal-protein-alanine N-acetyltransferase